MNFLKAMLILSFLLIPHQAYSWDAIEKTMLATIGTLQVIDVIQTHQMTTSGNYVEENAFTKQLTGDVARWYETTAIKIAVLVPTLYVIDKTTHSGFFRKALLSVIMAISIEPVIHNENEKKSGNRFDFNWKYLF